MSVKSLEVILEGTITDPSDIIDGQCIKICWL